MSANKCERSVGSDDCSALRLSCTAEPNAYGVKPLAADQVGEPKISYEPPSAERLSSAVEADPCTHQHKVKIHIMPPAAEQGGIELGSHRAKVESHIMPPAAEQGR